MPTLQRIRSRFQGFPAASLVGILCAWMAAPGQAFSQEPPPQAAPAGSQAAQVPEEAEKLTNDQLDSLVAPIALYPDPLLAQCLVASTYPIDVVSAQQWLEKNSSLKGDALAKEAENQPWDPSVQALVSIPDALKRLSENIAWTKDLGDAFLAQQSDVMDAVQRLRAKAKDAGKLESSDQQKVETQTVESKQVIVIQPASPEVVYVPTYSPTVIWGPPIYPYPPMYYPPYYAGAAWVGFGVGIAVGIGISGGWGWGCGWHGGGNTININNNNNYVNHYNRQNNVNRSGNSNWQHNAQQRGGAPYKDRATANKYGGGTRGDSMQSRQGQAQSRQAQSANRGGSGTGSFDRGGSASNRGGGSGSNFGGSGSHAGSRDVSPSSRGGSAFGGSQSGSHARSSSSRGASSMGSRGGGMSRGGGGGRRR
ncbi:MAG TPA: DUF3300 domain-containing protein [Thermoanaerobaculia bacterium]|nr:DUF3300 domain-containing protein [Thermoanaerobaculia bacterium]